MRQSLKQLFGLPERDSWITAARPHYLDIDMDEALGRAKTAEAEVHAALEARAKKTAAGIIEDRARAYASRPVALDYFIEPGLSALTPKQLRYRIAELIGEETGTRRPLSLGGHVTMINLQAAMVYAERLLEIQRGTP